MKLEDLSQAFKIVKSQDEFDRFVSENLIEITNLFYSFFSTDILKYELDSFYFGEILSSSIIQQSLSDKRNTPEFLSFILLLGVLGEKLAENDITSVADNVKSYLPESALKYRLIALSKVQNIDNARTDYIGKFNDVLNLLLTSENFEGGGTLQTIDFLIYYYQKAIEKLTELGLNKEIITFKNLFTNTENLIRYHFLNHEVIAELIAGRDIHNLQVEKIPQQVLYPSDIVEEIFRDDINKLIQKLPGTYNHLEPMGLDSKTIRGEILDYGKTNFDENYNTKITAEIKTLFYCYYNMKKHFFTSYAVFKKIWVSIKKTFTDSSFKPVFIDLGCGPLTSGLAIGDLFHSETSQKINFTYIGIDISNAMIDRAQSFSKKELFVQDHSFFFYNNWNQIPSSILKKAAGSNNPFIINASYLFASNSVDEKDLAIFVTKLTGVYKNVHFIFQNPDRTDRNTKWENFKKCIKFKLIDSGVEKVIYKTAKSAYREPTGEDVYFEILTIFAS